MDGGELVACDVDRSYSFLHSSFVPHARTLDALDPCMGSNVRRVRRNPHPLRYDEAAYSATTPVDLASIPETYGFIAADRARRRPRRIDHPTRAEFPESTSELRPCCWTAHPSPEGGIPASLTHRVIQNRNQGEFDTKLVIPCFDGESDYEDYLDWEQHVDDFFYYTGVPLERQVKYVVRKLTGRAGAWWMHLTQARRHEGRREVKTWQKMKQLLRRQFLTSGYELLTEVENSLQYSEASTEKKLKQDKSPLVPNGGDIFEDGNVEDENLEAYYPESSKDKVDIKWIKLEDSRAEIRTEILIGVVPDTSEVVEDKSDIDTGHPTSIEVPIKVLEVESSSLENSKSKEPSSNVSTIDVGGAVGSSSHEVKLSEDAEVVEGNGNYDEESEILKGEEATSVEAPTDIATNEELLAHDSLIAKTLKSRNFGKLVLRGEKNLTYNYAIMRGFSDDSFVDNLLTQVQSRFCNFNHVSWSKRPFLIMRNLRAESDRGQALTCLCRAVISVDLFTKKSVQREGGKACSGKFHPLFIVVIHKYCWQLTFPPKPGWSYKDRRIQGSILGRSRNCTCCNLNFSNGYIHGQLDPYPFRSYHTDGLYHPPSCACIDCYNGHWFPPTQVLSIFLSNLRVYPYPSMFGSQGYNHRFPKAPLHPYEQSQHKTTCTRKEKRPHRPLPGAAPLLVCYNYFELLQIPEEIFQMGKHQHKMHCSSYSQLIAFEFDGRRLISSTNISTLPETSENKINLSNGSKDILQCHGNINRRQVISYLVDYDSTIYFDARFTDEKLVMPSFPTSE